jgi:hypothetical protein
MNEVPSTILGRREHIKDDGAPGRALDPHAKRILLDHTEWYARLTKLAEVRQGGE